MKKVVFIAFWFVNFFSFGQHRAEIHCKHFLYGYPYGTPETNDLIIREAYALSNNDQRKFADWVAYKLDTLSQSGSGKNRKWAKDPWLAENETLEPEDYESANETHQTDRGHQAPLASLDGYDSYFEANYLSNITPQKSDLNQGVWVKLEDKERELTEKYGEIYVLTGPLYEKELFKLPKADEPHTVPSGYWKILLIEDKKHVLKTAAFIFDQNTSKNAPIKSGIVSIDYIEKRSGLDFLWLLDDVTETALEKTSFSDWINQSF